jgi:hypothetical protein
MLRPYTVERFNGLFGRVLLVRDVSSARYSRAVRLGVKYDGVAERIGASLNLVLVPGGSGADTYSREQVSAWLSAAGFGSTSVKTLPQLPGLAILRAERVG